MSLLASIIIGLLAGYIACKLTGNESKGLLVNLFLGVMGGFVGGWLFDLVGIQTYTWVGSVISAVVGASVCIWVFSKLGGSGSKKKK